MELRPHGTFPAGCHSGHPHGNCTATGPVPVTAITTDRCGFRDTATVHTVHVHVHLLFSTRSVCCIIRNRTKQSTHEPDVICVIPRCRNLLELAIGPWLVEENVTQLLELSLYGHISVKQFHQTAGRPFMAHSVFVMSAKWSPRIEENEVF